MLKAELHCHVEGAAPPELVQRLAQKYQVDVSGIIKNGAYVWHDFTSFLACYDKASSVFRTELDYRLLAHAYFSTLAEQGAIYGEIFASPDHAAQMGLSYQGLIEGLSKGIDDAHADTGIEGRIIPLCLRHLGPERAEIVAEQVANQPHDKVTGFGMAGDERMFDVADFAPAFETAADADLGLTVHAGELDGAGSVRAALDHLHITRIGHGVRAIEDPDLVRRLVDEQIVLEVCPCSNIALNVYPDFESHPLRQLVEAGVRVTLNSDDPPYFATSLEREYQIASDHMGIDAATIDQMTRTAIDAAFVDHATREKLLMRLDQNP